MAGELYFGMNDLYPGMGFYNTTHATQPEAADRQALVDDWDTAKKNPNVDPEKNKKIWVSVIATVIIMIAFSIAL